jgi:hypothetical protein
LKKANRKSEKMELTSQAIIIRTDVEVFVGNRQYIPVENRQALIDLIATAILWTINKPKVHDATRR